MAGGGSRAAAASLVLLVALLAFLASSSEAAPGETVGAFGMRPFNYVPCCACACTRAMNPNDVSRCACGGVWYQRCPSACANCACDRRGRCMCRDGFSISYDRCQANSCDQFFSVADAAAAAAAEDVEPNN